ncbi:MAG TPA: DUF29 domain-containing protein [Azospirillum sp.]
MGFGAKYDDDFYAWTQEQASRLREAAASGANLPLDWENLAEEIESVGKSDFRGLAKHLGRVIEHLLKLEFSPAEPPRSGWRRSVRNARDELDLILKDSPSLKARLGDAVEWAWRKGLGEATDGLEADGLTERDLPADCPYTADQLLDPGWWPANRHELD